MASFIDEHYQKIFPDGNRNAGGPQYFHYIETNGLDANNHKAYCGVSGSPIDPSKPPATIRVQRQGEEGEVCGDYHMCCWPCLCDAMRFATAEEHGGKTVLTIPDPCENEDALNGIREVSAYQCRDGKTANATHTASGRIAMAVLQNPRACVASEIEGVLAQCEDRMATPVEALRGGMGDIFAKVASVSTNNTAKV